MENAKEFYAAVKRGNSFLDAYRLVNFDRLTAARGGGGEATGPEQRQRQGPSDGRTDPPGYRRRHSPEGRDGGLQAVQPGRH